MFGRKKQKPEIDKEQLQLIQNAQNRIKQKKRLFYHVIFFIIVAIAALVLNIGLGFADEFTLLNYPWSLVAVIIWALLIFWHVLNVYVFNAFMGKAWEQQQLEKLVSKQQVRIEKLKNQLKKEDIHIAKSEVYNEERLLKNKQNLTIIVAAAENNAIGKDNKLIWHLSDDLKRFKRLTSGHCIIMGRKTFESFPKPLPNRTHIVITRQKDYNVPEGVITVNSLTDAIEKASHDSQPFIIGGGEIYKQAMPIANTIEITRVHESFEADTFFPDIDKTKWKEVNNVFHKKDAKNDHEFSFITYERKQ